MHNAESLPIVRLHLFRGEHMHLGVARTDPLLLCRIVRDHCHGPFVLFLSTMFIVDGQMLVLNLVDHLVSEPVVAPVLGGPISAAVLGLNILLNLMRVILTSVVAHNGDKLGFLPLRCSIALRFLGCRQCLVLGLKPIFPN